MQGIASIVSKASNVKFEAQKAYSFAIGAGCTGIGIFLALLYLRYTYIGTDAEKKDNDWKAGLSAIGSVFTLFVGVPVLLLSLATKNIKRRATLENVAAGRATMNTVLHGRAVNSGPNSRK